MADLDGRRVPVYTEVAGKASAGVVSVIDDGEEHRIGLAFDVEEPAHEVIDRLERAIRQISPVGLVGRAGKRFKQLLAMGGRIEQHQRGIRADQRHSRRRFGCGYLDRDTNGLPMFIYDHFRQALVVAARVRREVLLGGLRHRVDPA